MVAHEGQGPEITRADNANEQPGRGPMVGKLDKDQAARLHAKLDALYETVKDENNYAMARFDGALKDLRTAAP